MFQFVTIAMIAILSVAVIVNLVKGILRGLKKTVGSLIAIVLSALVAWLITALICKPSSGIILKLMDLVKGFLPEGSVQDLFTVEALGDALSYYATMLVAPFVFTLLYCLISILFAIVISILVKIVPPFKKPGILLNRLGGALVGLVCGVLVSIILLMPIVGTVDLVASLDGTLEQPAATEEAEPVQDDEDPLSSFVQDAADSSAVQIFRSVGCGGMYNLLASADFEGERIYLKNDLTAVLDMLDGVQTLGTEMSDYNQVQIDALDAIITDLDSSGLLRHTVAGVFSTASESWLEGEAFIGMKKPDAGELLNPVIDGMLEVMSTSTKDTIIADLTTMKDVFAILIENDLLVGSSDYSEMLNKFGSEGVISQLMSTITANERMLPLADCITELSIRALASNIGIPENSEEVYGMLMQELADVLNGSQNADGDRAEEICDDVAKALGNHGISVEGEAASNISQSIVKDLGDKSHVTADDVSEFFAVYAAAREGSGREARRTENGFMYLSDSQIPTFTVNADGTVSIGDRVLTNYSADSLRASAAFSMGADGVDFGNAASLFSPDTMVSDMITMDTIVSLLGQYGDCENIEEEIEKLAGVITDAVVVLSDIDFENVQVTEVVEKMGGLLDGMSETEIFGSETAQALLKAVMQSDMVSEQFGISKEEISQFADKVGEMVTGTEGTYADATVAVSGTINMMQSVTDENKTAEEKKEATKELLDNITPASAEVLGSMVTSSMVTDMGVPAENAEAVSSTVTSMLNNMASYENTEDSAAADREAEAVNQILNMAMNITPESMEESSLFNDGGEAGLLGVTAEEFVDLIAGSQVISQTLIETVIEQGYSDNPLGVPELSDFEKSVMTDAVHAYYEANGGGAELAQQLEALAAIVNISIDLH